MLPQVAGLRASRSPTRAALFDVQLIRVRRELVRRGLGRRPHVDGGAVDPHAVVGVSGEIDDASVLQQQQPVLIPSARTSLSPPLYCFSDAARGTASAATRTSSTTSAISLT